MLPPRLGHSGRRDPLDGRDRRAAAARGGGRFPALRGAAATDHDSRTVPDACLSLRTRTLPTSRPRSRACGLSSGDERRRPCTAATDGASTLSGTMTGTSSVRTWMKLRSVGRVLRSGRRLHAERGSSASVTCEDLRRRPAATRRPRAARSTSGEFAHASSASSASKGSNGFQVPDDAMFALPTARATRWPATARWPGRLRHRQRHRQDGDSRADRGHLVAAARHQARHARRLSPVNSVAASSTTEQQPDLHGAARRGRGDLAARRRHRRDEHHARHRHRADPRDRDPQGDRRPRAAILGPVPLRGGLALARRRRRRRRGRPHRQPLPDPGRRARRRAVLVVLLR